MTPIAHCRHRSLRGCWHRPQWDHRDMRQVASKDSQHSFKSFFYVVKIWLQDSSVCTGHKKESLHCGNHGRLDFASQLRKSLLLTICSILFVPGILTISRVLRLLGHNGKHGWRSRCWIHLWGEIWDNWAEKGPWLHDLENGQENGLQVGFKFLIKTGSNFSWIIWWTFQRAPVDQWKGKWELQHGLHKQATFTKSDISESNQNTILKRISGCTAKKVAKSSLWDKMYLVTCSRCGLLEHHDSWIIFFGIGSSKLHISNTSAAISESLLVYA